MKMGVPRLLMVYAIKESIPGKSGLYLATRQIALPDGEWGDAAEGAKLVQVRELNGRDVPLASRVFATIVEGGELVFQWA